MMYLIETENEYTINDYDVAITVYASGKIYYGTIPKRGDNIDVLIDGLVGMVGFLQEVKRKEHDAERKGIVK